MFTSPLLLLEAIILIISPPISIAVSSFYQPKLLWNHTIPGGGSLGGSGFRRGNGFVVSTDGKQLFATDELGSLHMVDLTLKGDTEGSGNTNNLISTYTPIIPKDHTTECRSSISIFQESSNPDTQTQFVVYTVIDIPKKNSLIDPIDKIN